MLKLFNRTGHKLGFQVPPHIVRAIQAAAMVDNHANDFEIMQTMGLSDIRTTQIYLENVLGKTNRTQREYNILAVHRKQQLKKEWRDVPLTLNVSELINCYKQDA